MPSVLVRCVAKNKLLRYAPSADKVDLSAAPMLCLGVFCGGTRQQEREDAGREREAGSGVLSRLCESENVVERATFRRGESALRGLRPTYVYPSHPVVPSVPPVP